MALVVRREEIFKRSKFVMSLCVQPYRSALTLQNILDFETDGVTLSQMLL